MIENIEATNVDSAVDEALRHHRAGRLDVAAPIYRQVLSVVPEHARALHLLGVAEHQAGRHMEAITLIGQAIEQAPDRAEMHNDLAQACMAAGQFDEATRACRRAVELKPDYGDAYLGLAASLEAQGNLDEAVGHYQQAVALAPDQPDAHFGLANVLARSDRPDEAVAAYEKALALAPGFLGARVNLAHTLKARHDFEAAAQHYRQALSLSPDNADIHASLGEALTSLGLFESALQSYERAVAIDPAQEEVRACIRFLGKQLQDNGELELAARAYTNPAHGSGHELPSAAATQADRMTYAMPECFNPNITRVATLERVISVEEVARIASIASEFELISGGVEGPLLHNENVRRSSVRWLKRTPQTYWIYARLMENILALNERYWHFDLNVLSDDIQYGEYAESGHYTWHMDLGGGNLSTRKLSFSVQLSHPDEYDGGELELKDSANTIVAPRDQGTLIVFPSFLMHRVAPVSRGLRRSLVGWASGTHPYR
jgi:tetratricopeptide (TPR) repeat protein/predicted 2-oxoglutarate/Fe(II)-dependent dioxygenase YbiX